MRLARHETGALLRAHLSAVAGTGHLTGRCAICRRLHRLALQAGQTGQEDAEGPVEHPEPTARTAERQGS